ncbi:MAG: integrase core domain-containing protein [Litorimonas sp.]
MELRPPGCAGPDNGLVFTAFAAREWLGPLGVKTPYTEAESLQEKGHAEGLDAELRGKLPDQEVSYAPAEARVSIGAWHGHHNANRPHPASGA